MLFMVTLKYPPASGGPDPGVQILKRFAKWTPPAGYQLKEQWEAATGEGSFLLVEASDAKALMEASAAWNDVMTITAVPVIPTAEAVPIYMKGRSWIDSVG